MEIKSTTKNYRDNNIYFLQLKINKLQSIQLDSILKGVITVYNKTLELQVNAFKAGFKEPLTPNAINLALEQWYLAPGGSNLKKLPAAILKQTIHVVCKECRDALSHRLDFKFPSPISEGYKGLCFTKGVNIDQQLELISLPKLPMHFKYMICGMQGSVYQNMMIGKIKKVWLLKRAGWGWFCAVHTYCSKSVGIRVVKVMEKLSKKRLAALAPYISSDNHWIVKAHQEKLNNGKG